MPLSFPCTAALLCFTVLVGSEDRRRWVGDRGVAYWRCGPRDECLCSADVFPVESAGSKAVCGGNIVEAIISELLRQPGRQTPGLDIVVGGGEMGKKDDATVRGAATTTTTTLLPSFGSTYPDLGKQFDENGSSERAMVGNGRSTSGEEEEEEEEEEEIVVRKNEDVDRTQTTKTGRGEENGERRMKTGQQRLRDKLGPQSIIDQRSRDGSESENGPNARRLKETTTINLPTTGGGTVGRQVYPGSGPLHLCSLNDTISLTLVGNYEESEELACLSEVRHLFLLERPLDKIDGNTFRRFKDLRLQELQVSLSNVTAVLDGAFRAFRENLVSLDLSGNRLDFIDAHSLSELQLLRTLNVSRNRLRNASFLSAKTGFPRYLQVLDLSSNAIESVSLAAEADEISTKVAGQSSESRLESSDPVEREFSRYLTTRERNPVDVTTTSRFQDSPKNPAKNARTIVSRFQNLQTIDLSRNRLTYLFNFSFVDLVQLRELKLSHNAIADIESDAFVLSTRYLTAETVTRRATKETDDDTQEYYISSALCNWGWPNLQLVDLSHNNLSYIRDGALSGALCTVRRLLLFYNRIDQLPRYLVERLPYLEHIDLSHNELAWLDVGAFTNPSLISIGLAHNRLRKIISMTFLYLPAVTSIDLSHNGLVYLYKFAFYRLCSSSAGLSTVKISLRSNHLQTDAVWKLMSTFQHLGDTNCKINIDLSNNNVTRFLGDAISFIRDRLAAADVQHFSHWSQVTISLLDNNIQCDCALVDDFRTIEKIYESIATNRSAPLQKISNLDSWKQLSCSKVSEGTPTITTVEEYLQSSDCERDFCFESCTCSRDGEGFAYTVNCSNLQLKALPTTTLIPNPELTLNRIRSFDLSGNNLTTVTVDLFRQMPSLEEIHLRKNHLTSVPSELLNLTGLRTLTLADNPLQCTCSEMWFQELVRLSADIVQDWNEITCSTERIEDKLTKDSVVTRVRVGTGSKIQNMEDIKLLLTGNTSDLCFQSNRSILNSTLTPAHTEPERIVLNWVRLITVCISVFLLGITAVAVRRLKKWLSRRKTLMRRGHGGRSKVSDTARQDEAKLELFVYCDRAQNEWVRKKLIKLISREFSHREIHVRVETIPLSSTNRNEFPVDVDHSRKPDLCRTTLIVISKDWINNRMAELASRLQADDLLDSSSTSSAFDHTVLVLIPKGVNSSDVHEHHCAMEQFPCLEIDDPLFQSHLFQHLERSFRIEAARPSSTNTLLKLTNGRRYESILENLRKY